MALQTKTFTAGDYAYQSWSNGYKIHLKLTEESTSTENNTSLISYVFSISNGSNNRFYDDNWSWSISIGGQTINIKNFDFYVYPYNVTQTIASGKITVTHNANGTLSMPFSVSVPNVKGSNQYGCPAMSITDSLTLTTIPRASSVSCTTVNIGVAPTITIYRNSTSFTHTLKYTFYSLSGTIVEKTPATTYTGWTIPLTFYDEIADAASGTGTITCETYNGSTLIGTSTCSFTANANKSSSAPTISPQIKDINDTTIALTGDSSVLVRYYSTAHVVSNAQANNGATIVSQSITNAGRTYSGGTCDFANVESGAFSFYAEDSRGYVTNTGLDISVRGDFVEYVKLTCTPTNNKPDASGKMTAYCSGNFFNGSFGAITNTLTAKYRYKTYGGSYGSWQTMTVVKNGNTYEAYTALTGLDYQAFYVFQYMVTDKLASVTSHETMVRSMPVFHWSSEDFVFEVPVTFNAGTSGSASNNIDGDCHITGDLRLKGSGTFGNTIYFGDASYCYLKEETDDSLTIKATGLRLDSTNLYLNDRSIRYGTWTPTLTQTSAVSSYSIQQGWYQKLGNTVTLGWQIKANVNSGYESWDLNIQGVPFVPAYAAFGGGVAHNIYIGAGLCFEGWSINASGFISARLQPCNNTSAGNLNIASTSSYPIGGGTVTLAGTICYVTNY